jgi:hypothetical protein
MGTFFDSLVIPAEAGSDKRTLHLSLFSQGKQAFSGKSQCDF